MDFDSLISIKGLINYFLGVFFSKSHVCTDIIPDTTLRGLKLLYRITITSWFLKYNEVVSLRELDVNKPNTRLRLSNRNSKV